MSKSRVHRPRADEAANCRAHVTPRNVTEQSVDVTHTCSPPRPHVQTTERVTGPTQWNVRGMKKLKIKITDLFFNETETNILF